MTRPEYIKYLYLALILAVFLLGLFVPLFDNDSAHHALIGMHMYLTNNYVELIDRGKDYLDKPHLLFWLAAIGDFFLGVGTLSYKLPSLLFAVPGVYATFELGKRLYNRSVGFHASLILLSTQAYILALNDVRMDALLLSFIITATWLLYEFTITYRYGQLLLGTLFLAFAFATKGMTGAAVPIIAVASQLLYNRNWTFIRSFKWLWAVPLFFVFISPVLYCYYLQYDLHPEKVIRGMTHISGLSFILFFQNTERLQGTNWGSSGSDDPFFFFHSLLWALLPWCLLGYWAVFRRGKQLLFRQFSFSQGAEVLSWTTIMVMFAILTSSNFKLPHYLNILFPFFSILIAGELEKITGTSSEGKVLMIVQKFVAITMVLLGLFINGYLFPVKPYIIGLISMPALYLLIYEWRSGQGWLAKLIGISFSSSLFLNVLMNGSFYPQIQRYQVGREIAGTIRRLDIPESNIYTADWDSPTMHYYSEYFYKKADPKILAGEGDLWLVGPEENIRKMAAEASLTEQESFLFPYYDSTKLKADFVNPATRQEACVPIRLMHLKRR